MIYGVISALCIMQLLRLNLAKEHGPVREKLSLLEMKSVKSALLIDEGMNNTNATGLVSHC